MCNSIDEWINQSQNHGGSNHKSRVHIMNSNTPQNGQLEISNNTQECPKSEIEKKILLGRNLCQIPSGSNYDSIIQFTHFDNSQISFSLTKEQLSMHLLLLGGIGTGKTNVFYWIVDALKKTLQKNDIMVIFDSKGDFYEKFRPMSNDIIIGNGERYRSLSHVWNIYAEVMGKLPPKFFQNYRYKKEWDSNVREIIKTMFKSRKSEQQPFFADAAADLVVNKMISVLRKGQISEMHTYKLKEFFSRSTIKDFDEYILDPDMNFSYAKQYYGDGTTPQALGVFGYINQMISDCFIGIFGDYQSDKEFAMSELVKQKGKRTLYVEYDLRTGEVLTPIYQLLYDQVLKEGLSRQNDNEGSIYLVCDEMKLLGKVEHISDGLNFGRSMGMKIISGLQSVEQLFDIYGDHKANAILSGFMNMFCFNASDYTSRKYISEHFGKNFVQIPFFKDGGEKDYYQREGFVVEEWDIQRLRRGEAIIDIWKDPPSSPFKFRFSRYKTI